jgi:hypothetical protein
VRPPSHFLPALLLALAACHDDTAGPPAPAPEGIACPLTERVRLASPPGDFKPADLYYALHRVGDHLLFTFDGPDDPARTYWHTSRCGGEVEEFTSLPPGLTPYTTVATDSGQVVYALDPDGQVLILDRLDVPGFDAPREVPGLPAIRLVLPGFFPTSDRRYATFFNVNDGGQGWSAAGIGAVTTALFTHTGDPDVPALQVGAALVNTFYFDDHLIVHDDDGTVRRFDPRTGASTTLLTGIRHVSLSPDTTRAIWQELGDDQSERVFLRDLDAGTDREIAVNDFAQQSWSRLPPGANIDGDTGRWTWTKDGAFAALSGPDSTFVAAVRTDTGEPLEIPEHIQYGLPLTRHFALTLADPTDHVDALWDPASGNLRVWHRSPVTPRYVYDDATSAEFLLPDRTDTLDGRLVRIDLATGTSTEILPRYSWYSGRLADDLYLYREQRGYILLEEFSDGGGWFATVDDLAFADPATQLYTPIADNISALALVPDEALYILDAHGEDPGVWAVPYPK